MRLDVIGSGSSGNMIVLQNDNEALVLDCGMQYKKCMQTVDYNVAKIVGTCVTHSHIDHSKYIAEFEKVGIPVYKPYEDTKKVVKFGKFTIQAFDVRHNVPCFGFYISHEEIGKLIYATDTCYCKYRFKGLNHILIECNYNKKLSDKEEAKYLHQLKDHMEQSDTMNFIKENNSDSLRTLLLCHLSRFSIEPNECVGLAKEIVSSGVYVDYARKGLEIEL